MPSNFCLYLIGYPWLQRSLGNLASQNKRRTLHYKWDDSGEPAVSTTASYYFRWRQF